jgi:hypothetical protein
VQWFGHFLEWVMGKELMMDLGLLSNGFCGKNN